MNGSLAPGEHCAYVGEPSKEQPHRDSGGKDSSPYRNPRAASRSQTRTVHNSLDRAVLFRGVDGTPAIFLPSLCRIYLISEAEIPESLEGSEAREVEICEFPDLASELYLESAHGDSSTLMRKHPPGIAIIVSQACNLTCSYCLAKQGTFGLPVHRMSLIAIKKRLQEIFEANPDIRFIKFFGGEPTLRLDLIERICEFVTGSLGKTVHFAVTTNGTLSAEAHIDVWRRFRVSVSVSIDGPQFIHDDQRKDKLGRGSYVKALAYINQLRSCGFPFAVVGVFDERHLNADWSYLDTIQFLNTLSPLTKVQFLETLGSASSHEIFGELASNDIARVVKEVEDAVDAIFDVCTTKWIDPNGKWLYDNNIMRFLSGIVRQSARPYEHACTASNLTTIFPGGETMPCYTFAEDAELALGAAATPAREIEERRRVFQSAHTWEHLHASGVRVPWYRGVVGDICVSDMRNAARDGVMKQSEFYAVFQETAVRRLLQRVVSIRDNRLDVARLNHAVVQHQRITGEFAYPE